MAAILGISGLYHDSAACLLIDGEICAAAQEERFTRKKHDASLPRHAVDYCLKEAALSPEAIDYVVFYEKPLLKFDRLLETYLAFAPEGFPSFFKAMPQWLKKKLYLPKEIRGLLNKKYHQGIAFTGHHESHAASAFFVSPFEEAAVLTVDGVGEWDTTALWHGRGNALQLKQKLNFPHSLGLLYSAFTYQTGFRVNSGEYKLMGLAPYGKPTYRELILEELIDLKPDGSFRLNMSYFNFCQGLTMTNRKFDRLFDGPPREPESPLTWRELNLAASIQSVTEEILLRLARTARAVTGSRNLCLSGGVALNCVANGKILDNGVFDELWIQPASGDAGGALGAALFLHYSLLENARVVLEGDGMKRSLLGPSFTSAAVAACLESQSIPYERLDSGQLIDRTVDALESGQVVGWFQGRMEFGPRALGSRSILGDPRNSKMQSRMNLKIKYRESFRPFAPSVLEEDASTYFRLAEKSPYMLLVAEVLGAKQSEREGIPEPFVPSASPDLRSQVNEVRSAIPAVTHVDNTARVQTISAENGRFHELLVAWKERTGCSVLINTSFNIRGEPIVCSPADALHCFLSTDMDILVMEDCLIRKTPELGLSQEEKDAFISGFQLD